MNMHDYQPFMERINGSRNASSSDSNNPNQGEFMKQPDAKKHFQLSMAKSAVRIAAGFALIWPESLILAGIFLILAEVIGVAEEMV
jgi:hypothetical protein